MSEFSPGYGETPLEHDELARLTPQAREALGDTVTKAVVYDVEQEIQAGLAAELISSVLQGRLQLRDLLVDHFVRDLHRDLYCDLWDWAGLLRRHELNIGVPPEQIAVELRNSLDTIAYRWNKGSDLTCRELGLLTHADLVRIHPFVDGNGRTTRLLADLVFLAAQNTEEPDLYDWDVDKAEYIRQLRLYDSHRQPHDLAAFIAVRPLDH